MSELCRIYISNPSRNSINDNTGRMQKILMLDRASKPIPDNLLKETAAYVPKSAKEMIREVKRTDIDSKKPRGEPKPPPPKVSI
jgi:hypothetical protein